MDVSRRKEEEASPKMRYSLPSLPRHSAQQPQILLTSAAAEFESLSSSYIFSSLPLFYIPFFSLSLFVRGKKGEEERN